MTNEIKDITLVHLNIAGCIALWDIDTLVYYVGLYELYDGMETKLYPDYEPWGNLTERLNKDTQIYYIPFAAYNRLLNEVTNYDLK